MCIDCPFSYRYAYPYCSRFCSESSFFINYSKLFEFHLFSLMLLGKVGGFIASIPEVMVAALLCFMWAMLTALGLSNLRYSEAGSSRNIIIIGLSLFFSLSIPAYFQQYGVSPNTNLSVPSYFQPYIVASHGPVHTKSGEVGIMYACLVAVYNS